MFSPKVQPYPAVIIYNYGSKDGSDGNEQVVIFEREVYEESLNDEEILSNNSYGFTSFYESDATV